MQKQNFPPINNQQSKQDKLSQIYCYKPYLVKGNRTSLTKKCTMLSKQNCELIKAYNYKIKQPQAKYIRATNDESQINTKILLQNAGNNFNYINKINNKINQDKKQIKKRKSLSVDQKGTVRLNHNNPLELIISQNQVCQKLANQSKQIQLNDQKNTVDNNLHLNNIQINVQKNVKVQGNWHDGLKQQSKGNAKSKSSRSFIIKKKISTYQKDRTGSRKQNTQLYINNLINANNKVLSKEKNVQPNIIKSVIRPNVKIIKVKTPFKVKQNSEVNFIESQQTKYQQLCLKSKDCNQIQDKADKQSRQSIKIVAQTVEQNLLKPYQTKQLTKIQQARDKNKLYKLKDSVQTQKINQSLDINIESSKSIIFKKSKITLEQSKENQIYSKLNKNQEELTQNQQAKNNQQKISKQIYKKCQTNEKQRKSISQISSRNRRTSFIKAIKGYYYPEQKIAQKVKDQSQINVIIPFKKLQKSSNNDSYISKKKDESFSVKSKKIKQKQVQCFTHKVNWGRLISKKQKYSTQNNLFNQVKQKKITSNKYLKGLQLQEFKGQIILTEPVQKDQRQQNRKIQPHFLKQKLAFWPMSKQFIEFQDPGLSAIFKKQQMKKYGIINGSRKQLQSQIIQDIPLQSLHELYCQLGSYKQFSYFNEN